MALYKDGEHSKTIVIYFVQDGASCSKEMRHAFSICQEAQFNPKIIPEDSVKERNEYGSNVVYVLETFSRDTFDFLSERDCLVVGPSCMVSCVMEKIPIPNNDSPVFNISLRGIVVCTTQLRSKDKDEIKKLVGYMGAIYSDDLSLAVTHLIAENISSILIGKSGKAVQNNIPLIWPEWIRKSWELTQMGGKAPDPSNFRLPPFQGMHISCSNLSMSVKKKLQRLIESNGGIYQGTLEKKTVVLVIGDPEGKKWQFAQQWEIPCVSPSWVYESAERGSLVHAKNYLVVPKLKCSTPTHSTENDSFMSSDLSVVPMSSEKSNVDETNTSFGSDMSVRSVQSDTRRRQLNPRPVENEYKQLLENLSMNEVRSAGMFLDGCKIYLSGFTPLEFDKLKKIINAGGATLFPSISDCLSHIVVGEFSLSDAKELSSLNPRPNVVKLEWLIQCYKSQTTADVEPYLCLQNPSAPPASPLSDKGVKLLKAQNRLDSTGSVTLPNESRSLVSRKLFVKATVTKPSFGVSQMDTNSIDLSALERKALEEMNKEKEQKEQEIEKMKKKIEEAKKLKDNENEHQNLSEQNKISKDTSDNDGDQSNVNPFFQGLRFEILGYDDIQQLQESIELVGGKVVLSHSDPPPDYAIVPVEGTDIPTSAKKIVSIIFVEDCYDHNALVTELQYYHCPLPDILGAQTKLEGTVFTLSGFSQAEKRLLEFVATKLGAIVQSLFSRYDYSEKGVKKSTHLLCKEMSGKKYEAALKWGIPIITPASLLELIEPETPESAFSTQQLSQSGLPNYSPPKNIEVESHDANSQQKESSQVLSRKTSHNLKRSFGSANEETLHPGVRACTESKSPEDVSLPGAIKRWKANVTERLEPPTSKLMSPPTEVLKKQLWSKFGGVPFDGIDTETGELLSTGPYSEWAKENSSGENSIVGRPPDVSENSCSTDATPNRRKWNAFLKSYPDPWPENSPAEPTKPKRPSTPLDVIKKQLWVKFGGVSFEGIEPDTGKLLRDGPYAEWAKSSLSRESSFTETPKRHTNKPASGVTDDVVAELHRRLSEVKTSKEDSDLTNIETIKDMEDLSPAMRRRLSNRIDVTQDPNSSARWEHGTATHLDEGKQPVLWDFNPIHSSTVCGEGVNLKTNAATSQRDSDSSKSMNFSPMDSIPSCSIVPSRSNSSNPLVSKEIKEPTVSTLPDVKVFLLSGLPTTARQKYEGIIKLLGGGLAQSGSYDSSTTHIIIEKPVRSEKLLCCIASGRWVLHTLYLDYCYESRKFLSEEQFEWGNPASSSRLPKLQPGSTEARLATAAFKWRQRKRDMGSAAPFRDMKVLICTSENRQALFRRLLEAGSATILPLSDILKTTHIIWEHEKVNIPLPLEDLAAKKIHVVQPLFLNECLIKTPHPAEHYPPPYLKVVKERRLAKKI